MSIVNKRESQSKNTSEWIKGVTLSDGAEPREEIMLFPYGYFNHEMYGVLDFTERFHNEVIKNFKNNVLNIEPFMDQEHDKGKALAWFDSEPYYRQGLGTFIKPNYTALGKDLLGSKQYKYFSPWFEDFTDPITKKVSKNVFRGGAATNVPFLKTMPSIIQELEDDGNTDVDIDGKKDIAINIKLSEIYTESQSGSESVIDNSETSEKPGTSESEKNILKEKSMNEKLKKSLIKLYKLDENASDEDVEKAAETAADEVEKEKPAEEPKKEEDTVEEEPVEENKEAAELKEQVNNLQKQLTEQKAEKLISKALSEGKIIPADKKKWTEKFLSDPKGTEDTIGLLKPIVELSEKGFSTEGQEAPMSDCELMDVAKKIQKEQKIKTLSEAIIIARQENPQLGKDYEEKYLSDPKRKKHGIKRF